MVSYWLEVGHSDIGSHSQTHHTVMCVIGSILSDTHIPTHTLTVVVLFQEVRGIQWQVLPGSFLMMIRSVLPYHAYRNAATVM